MVSSTVDVPLSASPVTVTFDGRGGFAFTAADTGYGPGAAVATPGDGGGGVTTFGIVTDLSAGSSIDQDGELYTFAGYPSAATIPYSAADDFIGLSVPLSDGTHYGYAEVNGSTLVGVGFETTPDATIQTGAQGASSDRISVAVPEQSTGLAACGVAAAAAASRRRRR